MFVSIGVYAVDLFTACNLLFFDRWSGQVQPVIPFKISRWIFAGCIILTWILLAYRLQRAIRAIKTGSVTKCYLDPLAVRIQSIRISKNDPGWKKFLVFAALTRGRKGAEYVALFTYFTFEGKSFVLYHILDADEASLAPDMFRRRPTIRHQRAHPVFSAEGQIDTGGRA